MIQRLIVIMAIVIFTLSSVFFFSGCDSGSSLPGVSKYDASGSRVGYTVDCTTGVKCSGTDDIVEISEGNVNGAVCVWYCSPYKGQDDRYVEVAFRKEGGGCWRAIGDYVSDGLCE